MRPIQLPGAEWSVRAFGTPDGATTFYRTLHWSGFEPAQATEDLLGPGGIVIRAGSWLVVYRVFQPNHGPEL